MHSIKKEDKFIIIGSNSFFNILTNDEIVNSIGAYYIKKKNANETSLYLIELLKNKRHKKVNNNLLFNSDKMYLSGRSCGLWCNNIL